MSELKPCFLRQTFPRGGGGGGALLPDIGYTGMCRWKGCGFKAIYSAGTGSSNHRNMI